MKEKIKVIKLGDVVAAEYHNDWIVYKCYRKYLLDFVKKNKDNIYRVETLKSMLRKSILP